METVTIYEPQPNDNWPYFKCPKCRYGFIERSFTHCICGSKIELEKIKIRPLKELQGG